MTAQTLPRPDLAGTGDHLFHIVCCDQDRALCGADMRGVEAGLLAEQDPADVCAVCVDLDEAGVPCGRPFCQLRLWWRRRRS